MRLSDEAQRRATRLRHIKNVAEIGRTASFAIVAATLYEQAADLLRQAEHAEEATRQ